MLKVDIKSAFRQLYQELESARLAGVVLPASMTDLEDDICLVYLVLTVGSVYSPSEYCLVASVILKVFTSLGPSRPDLFGPESFGGQVYVDDALLAEMDFMDTPGRLLEARDAYRWSVESFFGSAAIEEKKFALEGVPVKNGLPVWGYMCDLSRIHLGPSHANVGFPLAKYDKLMRLLEHPGFVFGATTITLSALEKFTGLPEVSHKISVGLHAGFVNRREI